MMIFGVRFLVYRISFGRWEENKRRISDFWVGLNRPGANSGDVDFWGRRLVGRPAGPPAAMESHAASGATFGATLAAVTAAASSGTGSDLLR